MCLVGIWVLVPSDKHNEEGEPMLEENIPWLMVLVFTLGTLIRVLFNT